MMSTKRSDRFETAQAHLPIVAILRGILMDEAEAIATTLYQNGFRLIEVSLSSPGAFSSINIIRKCLPINVLIGAGTVKSMSDMDRLANIGADLVVMPHTNIQLIREAKKCGLICMPGVITPSEALAALEAGADVLKIFPAELVSPNVVKSILAVLPKGTRIYPVGGIRVCHMHAYLAAGVSGFGLGSALYKPGITCKQLASNAKQFVDEWDSSTRRLATNTIGN